MKIGTIIIAIVVMVVLPAVILWNTGAGSFKRMIKISGIYTVCRPDRYDAVCFIDADPSGGMYCIPLSQLGGECK